MNRLSAINGQNGIASMPAGQIIRSWRQKRRMSQMELAGEANISARHLCFVETGRANASAMTLMALSNTLEIPLTEQNQLLLAAGFAPRFSDAALTDSALEQARLIIERIVASHEPYPAFAVDENWDLIAGNEAHHALLEMMTPKHTRDEIGGNNLMRYLLHPLGMRNSIANWEELQPAFVDALRRECGMRPNNTELRNLLCDVRAWTAGDSLAGSSATHLYQEFAVPIRFRLQDREFTLVATTLTFTAPLSTALQGIRLETFYPLDSESENQMHTLLDHGL